MSDKKPFAAFTIVRNEPFFLRLWCEYYSRAFGDENLYILDNGTTDDSVNIEKHKRPRINVKSVPSEFAFEWGWTTKVIKSFQASALTAYDVVVYADADEFLLPSAQFRDLRELCEQFRASQALYLRARGWGVVQQIQREPMLTLDCTSPLGNRGHMWAAPAYDKTLVSKVQLNWAKGLHTVRGANNQLTDDPRSPHLDLLHLRDVDIGVLYRRSLDRFQMPALRGDVHLTWGSIDRRELETWFMTRKAPWAPDNVEFAGEVQPIPEHWRRLMRLG